MRAAPIGAYFADDISTTIKNALLSAQVTHTHPEGIAVAIAVAAAIAIAIATQYRKMHTFIPTATFLELVISHIPTSEVRSKLIRAQNIESPDSISFAIEILGNGTSMLNLLKGQIN